MIDVPVMMHDPTDGKHDHGILDLGIKLDAKVQRRPWIMKDQSPEVFWADFDNVFSVCNHSISLFQASFSPGFMPLKISHKAQLQFSLFFKYQDGWMDG